MKEQTHWLGWWMPGFLTGTAAGCILMLWALGYIP